MPTELDVPRIVPAPSSERSGGSLLSAISEAMVHALKQHYGKGPTGAKSYMVDNYLFVAMEDGLTVIEETLLRAGKHDLVREVRQTFHNEMAAEFSSRIEELTGRRVLAYQSQLTFDPYVQFEIFVFDPKRDGDREVVTRSRRSAPSRRRDVDRIREDVRDVRQGVSQIEDNTNVEGGSPFRDHDARAA